MAEIAKVEKILPDVLLEYMSRGMLTTLRYDVEKALKAERERARAEGFTDGRSAGLEDAAKFVEKARCGSTTDGFGSRDIYGENLGEKIRKLKSQSSPQPEAKERK